ncbi:hypothetical protein RF11_00854 [Thelohanellus kitauei]|uniref:Uncharacterized protein n=1 Tax=Thelohanellus kitauei TaxID=669202 RepID=A0A0C2MTP5_THEKT|nr:hypothetical protein RF11_00854 [Thelohanellus kitauei]
MLQLRLKFHKLYRLFFHRFCSSEESGGVSLKDSVPFFPITKEQIDFLFENRLDGRRRVPTVEDYKNMQNGWYVFRPPFPSNETRRRNTSELVYKDFLDFYYDHLKLENEAKYSKDHFHQDGHYYRRPGHTGCDPVDKYYRRTSSMTQPPNPQKKKK